MSCQTIEYSPDDCGRLLHDCKTLHCFDYLYSQISSENLTYKDEMIWCATEHICKGRGGASVLTDDEGAEPNEEALSCPNSGLYPLLLPIQEPDVAEREVEVAIRIYGHAGVAIPCVPRAVRLNNHCAIDRIRQVCVRLAVPLIVIDCSLAQPDDRPSAPRCPDGQDSRGRQ